MKCPHGKIIYDGDNGAGCMACEDEETERYNQEPEEEEEE